MPEPDACAIVPESPQSQHFQARLVEGEAARKGRITPGA
jgi:hypothetical protein